MASRIFFALLFVSIATVASVAPARAITTLSSSNIDIDGTLNVSGTTTLNGSLLIGDGAVDLLTVNAIVQGASPFVFEGATANDFETTFAFTDPTADRTITFQDGSGTVAFLSDIGAAANMFETMNAPSGTDPVADSSTDTLNFVGSANLTVTGDETTDTLTFDLGAAVSLLGQTISNGEVDDDLTISASGSVADGALSATVAHLNVAETIASDWVNTANPWADNEVADGLTISSGTINGTIIGGTTPAAGFFANLTSTDNTFIGDADTDQLTVSAALFGDFPLLFEGATINASETTFAVTDPTADRTITFPDASGTVVLSGGAGSFTSLSSTGATTLGSGTGSVEINSPDWDISDTGVMTGIGTINMDGSLVLSNVATDISSGTNEDLVLNPNGAGNLKVSGLDCTGNSNGGALTAAADGTISCTDDDTGSAANIFETMNAPSGTDPVAESSTDTLNFAAGSANFTVTGDSSTDTLTFDVGANVSILGQTISNAEVDDDLTISGGTVDNSIIGGSTAAAGTFTVLTANGDTVIGDASADALTVAAEIRGASPLSFEGSTNDNLYTIFAITDPTTSNKTITFPDASITVNAAADLSGTVAVGNGGTGAGSFTANGVLYGNGTSALGVTATGSAGQILQSNGSGSAPGYSTATYPSTAGTAGNVLRSDGTNFVSTAITTGQFTPSDPSTTTSTTGVMMGIGSTATITPVRSGIVFIMVTGDIDNNTAGNGAQVQIRTGTGSAPSNGDALTGTAQGGLVKYLNPNQTGGVAPPTFTVGRGTFGLNAVVSGLTPNTTVWIDVGLAAITGGTARIRDLSVSAFEL